jgi:nitronate monooxygenase
MGTRFMNTKECLMHPRIKELLEKTQEMETAMVTESIQNPGRVIRNPWAEKVLEMEKAGKTLEELAPLISGQNSLKALFEGIPDEGLIYCGQVVGRIEDTPSVDELMKRIMDEAVEVKERMDGLFL